MAITGLPDVQKQSSEFLIFFIVLESRIRDTIKRFGLPMMVSEMNQMTVRFIHRRPAPMAPSVML